MRDLVPKILDKNVFSSIIQLGMQKLRELEILGYILREKRVTTSSLAQDLGISLELATRWLGYLHQKGWLSKKILPQYNGRFFYELSPYAENIVQQVKNHNDTWEKVAWFGLGALVAIALTKGIKGSKQKRKQGKKQKND